jgi:MinD-like ATPase involved in chromosome partitioning or flagellar assembly
MDSAQPLASDPGDLPPDPDELPEGDLEVDDDDDVEPLGVIIPFAKATDPAEDGRVEEVTDGSSALAVADEISLDGAPLPTAFVGAPRRITFFSLNGGTGKTTLCTEIAALLATRGEHTPNGVDKHRLRVAVIDLDLRSASLSVRLGIPQPTIWDLATASGSEPDLNDYLVRHRSGITALLGPPKPVPASNTSINPEMVADIVAELEAAGYHYIFFDVSSELTPTTTWVLNAVHDIFVVMTSNASGIQDAYRTAAILRRMGLRHKLSYVVNRARKGIDVGPTMADLSGKLVAQIPYDQRVEDAENAHRLVIDEVGPAADAITRLAAAIYPGLAALPRKPRLPLPWRRRQAR